MEDSFSGIHLAVAPAMDMVTAITMDEGLAGLMILQGRIKLSFTMSFTVKSVLIFHLIKKQYEDILATLLKQRYLICCIYIV